jgi:hypothetical protein
VNKKIKSRLFIVGCPRSGTTLLQSLLAVHPQISSFPETHFFSSLVPSRSWFRALGTGIASRRARVQLEQYLEQINAQEMKTLIPKKAFFMHPYCQAFVSVLDKLTLRQGKICWIEKTPGHLHFIKYIEKLVLNSKFIHIIRGGENVIASLYKVTHEHPQVWGGPRSIDQCINRWINDTQITRSHLHKPNHTLVRYELLVEVTEKVLTEVCRFIGVKYDEKMLKDYQVAANQIVLGDEPWKASVEKPIGKVDANKFYRLFDEGQRLYILGRLKEVSIDKFTGQTKLAERVE